MPKWIRRAAAIAAAVTTGTVGLASNAHAATPAITFGSTQVALTLPSGCHANRFQVSNSPDGSYHGYLQATCNGQGRFFLHFAQPGRNMRAAHNGYRYTDPARYDDG
jgi:hypothetical protein